MLKERMAGVWAKLVKKYRLVLFDHESLSQTRRVMIRPLTAILGVSGTLLAVTTLTALLIFKAPIIHKHIPGFQSHLSEDYMVLQRKNNELEREVAEMDSMLKVFTSVMGSHSQVNGSVWESPTPTVAENNVEPGKVAESSGNPEQNSQALPSHLHALESRPVQPGPSILNLVAPIDGYVTKDFEPKDKPHYGIDLAAEENSMVRSVADGMVVFSEYSNTTGYVIGIWHSQSNLISFYKHNSRLFKTVGSYVFAGEAIAVIGNTGINSTGTHLHFELWYDNNPVNPADYIQFN